MSGALLPKLRHAAWYAVHLVIALCVAAVAGALIALASIERAYTGRDFLFAYGSVLVAACLFGLPMVAVMEWRRWRKRWHYVIAGVIGGFLLLFLEALLLADEQFPIRMRWGILEFIGSVVTSVAFQWMMFDILRKPAAVPIQDVPTPPDAPLSSSSDSQ